MLLFSEILEGLTYGELSQYNTSDNGVEITEEEYSKVGAHLKLALNDLHRRFELRQKRLTLTLAANTTRYYLLNTHATSSGSADPHYLDDSIDNLVDAEFLFVDSIYDENLRPLVLNNAVQKSAIQMPTTTTLDFTDPVEGTELQVVYRCKHAPLTINASIDPVTTTIQVPDLLLEPILLFIGSRMTPNIGVDGQAIANNLYMRYETKLAQIKQEGHLERMDARTTKLEQNMWP